MQKKFLKHALMNSRMLPHIRHTQFCNIGRIQQSRARRQVRATGRIVHRLRSRKRPRHGGNRTWCRKCVRPFCIKEARVRCTFRAILCASAFQCSERGRRRLQSSEYMALDGSASLAGATHESTRKKIFSILFKRISSSVQQATADRDQSPFVPPPRQRDRTSSLNTLRFPPSQPFCQRTLVGHTEN